MSRPQTAADKLRPSQVRFLAKVKAHGIHREYRSVVGGYAYFLGNGKEVRRDMVERMLLFGRIIACDDGLFPGHTQSYMVTS